MSVWRRMELLSELIQEKQCPAMQRTYQWRRSACAQRQPEDHQPSNRNQEMTGWFCGYRADAPTSVWVHALSFHSASEAICSNWGQEDDGTSLSSSLQPLMSTLASTHGALFKSPAEARPFCWISISISVNKNKLAGQQSGLPSRVCLPTD